MSNRLLNAEQSVLLIVDIQEKFVPVIQHAREMIETVVRLARACDRLEVPVVVSEQYPRGLGYTVPEIREVLPPSARLLEKCAFGCGGDEAIRGHLKSLGRRQVMICGLETHVCVNQTAHQLLEEGYEVHLIQDAISSRHEQDRKTGFKKMIQSGAIPSCSEMALFEMMGSSKHPAFREVQALVK